MNKGWKIYLLNINDIIANTLPIIARNWTRLTRQIDFKTSTLLDSILLNKSILSSLVSNSNANVFLQD